MDFIIQTAVFIIIMAGGIAMYFYIFVVAALPIWLPIVIIVKLRAKNNNTIHVNSQAREGGREEALKRQEPCFWITDNCPVCGHSCPIVYSPDLLKGPLDRVCGSRNNPIRKNNICHNKWGFAATEEKKQEIRGLLRLAARQDELWEEYQNNRKRLGYH